MVPGHKCDLVQVMISRCPLTCKKLYVYILFHSKSYRPIEIIAIVYYINLEVYCIYLKKYV